MTTPGDATHASALARTRRQQYLEDIEAAVLRAHTGDSRWFYASRRLYHGQRRVPLRAPHLKLADDCLSITGYRAVSDALALRERFSDDALHQHLRPAEPEPRLIYDWLEQCRVEALLGPGAPGMASNLEQRFRQWSLDYHHAQFTETALGLLLFCVIQISRSRLMAAPMLEAFEDMLEATRANIVPALGHALAGLRRERHDQAAFQRHAHAIADWIAAQLEGLEPQQDREQEDKDPRRALALLLDSEDDLEEEIPVALSGQSRLLEDDANRYRAFTTAYDSERRADSLVRHALLVEYRDRLDQRLAAQKVNVRRLARAFRRHLSVVERDGWNDGEESGVIDGRRLSQIVTSPQERRVFLRERHRPVSDAQVSLLIDCSGSMKVHGEAIATLVELLARALDMAGVSSEVLGFTTGAWNGGRAQRDWLRSGRPAAPGRLNEARHLIIKDASQPWRRARLGLAALLKADIYKEGIDGEAVQWACQRLMSADVNRRLLVVISDGSPSDSATNLANDRHYLDHHLRSVVATYSGGNGRRSGPIDIVGLGVGLDLSPYYPRHRVIDIGQTLDNTLLDDVVELMLSKRRY
ncbi:MULTISPECIES: cobaltochelatase CobT-related protein [unclassified Halomonas]|uniref:cobaltochelatase CobT-related protein n=1 Tax=unclassified Halomonas TaxID=2609666 RepID=UPI001C96B84C|nr:MULTISPECIES: cobalamin biosynthesis protein CobT [unclassified Halomonas]MBY5924206.1 cobalamin biosynthesis protein CobT [Halomonas sp. DP4Y7-2]MBY6231248.1 cobalamin biosynthesis protein CobT [Halomonas sp. DP4Y7-1]